MTQEEINKLYKNRISNIDGRFINRMFMQIGLCGYSLFNRIIITEQLGSEISDVRTISEWELLGRRVENLDNKVYILESRTIKQYVDNANGKIVDYSELTPEEMKSALEYDMIHIESRESESKVVSAYRYKDTVEINDKYKEVSRLKFKDIVKAMQAIYNVDVMIGEENKYENNTLTFDADHPNTVIQFIVEFISERVDVKDTKLLESALNALVGIRKNITSNEFDIKELEKIFIITDEIMYKSGKVRRTERISDEQLRRVSKILGILESVYFRSMYN